MPPQLVVGSVTITAAEEDEPPSDVDALVLEEDTYRVLSADAKISDSDEDLEELLKEAIEDGGAALGSVLVTGEQPTRLLAIVHDLNEEPSWREEWISKALDGIFLEATNRKLTSLAMPLLGTVHGAMATERSVVLLSRALKVASLTHLEHIYLIVPSGTNQAILEILASELEK